MRLTERPAIWRQPLTSLLSAHLKSNMNEQVSSGHADTQQKPSRREESSPLLHVRPMEAVSALYSTEHLQLSAMILSNLCTAIFEQPEPPPAGLVQRIAARASYRLMKWTTVRHPSSDGSDQSARFRNRLLERSRHPYARSLLASSSKETEALVEGGDPMNGPYMMICADIRQTCTLWDRLFFNSVQGRDVQLRFIWETKATYEEAKKRLDMGTPVRIKAFAAGTGLSMILAYDRLVRDGYDTEQITMHITDRDPANTMKTRHLLRKLAASRGWKLGSPETAGISAHPEDIFGADEDVLSPDGEHDVVTAVGILEYLQGSTCETTEQRHQIHEPEETATAFHFAERLRATTHPQSSLIVNTYRPHSSTRMLELFGKRFDYRDKSHLVELLSAADFRASHLVGSGLIYDLKVYVRGFPGPGGSGDLQIARP